MNSVRRFLLLYLILFGIPYVYAGSDAERLPPPPGGAERISADSETVRELEPGPDEEVILDIYTVRRGDWLTKIAEREYGDGELWKLIRRYNEFIRDPHWIFPGDRIIIPRVVRKIPEVEIPEEEPEPEPEPETVREKRNFLGAPDYEFDAVIAGFRDDKSMQAQGDYCFIDLGSDDGIEEGMTLNIYRQGRRVVNPSTGEVMGNLYTMIGRVRVTGDINRDSSTARVVYSDIPLESGDRLLLRD